MEAEDEEFTVSLTMQWVPGQPDIKKTHLNKHANTWNDNTGPGIILSPTPYPFWPIQGSSTGLPPALNAQRQTDSSSLPWNLPKGHLANEICLFRLKFHQSFHLDFLHSTRTRKNTEPQLGRNLICSPDWPQTKKIHLPLMRPLPPCLISTHVCSDYLSSIISLRK